MAEVCNGLRLSGCPLMNTAATMGEKKQNSDERIEIHTKIRLRMCFLKLLSWGQSTIVLYVVEKSCVSLLVEIY